MDRFMVFIKRYGAVLFFCFFLGIGLLLFDDYGCGPDEGMERQTSLVNCRYIVERFDIPVSERVSSYLSVWPELKDYRDRYYGTALHYPLVLIESFFDFYLEPAVFYGMRHLYTFLNFYAGVFCFYLLLKKRFPDSLFPLAGTLMLTLSPRIFAESFYNNKDVLFLAWYIISCYCIVCWLEKPGWKNSIITGVVLSLTCNTRINGIVLLPIMAVFAGVICLSDRQKFKNWFCFLCLLFSVFVLATYIITPNMWDSPLQTFIEMFQFSSKHPNHGSDGNLFFGQLVDAAKTWYFIPVWVILTTPTLYLLLCVTGFVKTLSELFRTGVAFAKSRECFMDLFMTSVGLAPVLVIIAMRVVIYNSWRHCYFAYASIIYLAVVGLSLFCGNRKRISVLMTAVLICTLGYNGFWIASNHPFEYVYFSPLFRSKSELFSGDYWGVASRDMLSYIVSVDDSPRITIDHTYTNAGSINRGLLPVSDRDRVDMVYDPDNADYIVYSRDDKPAAASDSFFGYEKVYSIVIDEDEIGTVFKRQSDE